MRKIIEKLREDKGFTLAELLIVVAIIAVLVAIAIPVFTSQLEKSREATDLSNARAMYAEMMTYAVTGETTGFTSSQAGVAITYAADTYTATLTGLKQATAGWQSTMTDSDLGGVKFSSWSGSPSGKTGTCVITFKTDTQVVTITWS